MVTIRFIPLSCRLRTGDRYYTVSLSNPDKPCGGIFVMDDLSNIADQE